MMIELKGRGFALLVLSFIADNRDTQEPIRWRLGFACKFRSNSQRRGDNPSLVAFRYSNLNSAETDPVSDQSRDEMLV